MSDFVEGMEFKPAHFNVTVEKVADYLAAIGEENAIYRGKGLVPPMAIGALSMIALNSSMKIPAGSVHVAQEFQFQDTVKPGQELVCRSRVSRRITRGAMNLVAVDMTVNNQEIIVLTGKLTLNLPVDGGK